MLPWQPVR